MWKYLFYKLSQLIIHCVPRGGAYAFARFLSDLQFNFSPRDRASVIRNLRQIMGERPDLAVKAREVFRGFGEYLVDFFFMYQVNPDFVKRNVRLEGHGHLQTALERGKGAIILTAHIGNWEMGAAVLGNMGYKVTAIALPHKDRIVNDLFNRQREKHGVTVVASNVAVRRCFEALRKGNLVAMLGDRDFGTFGEPLMFLGRKTLIPKGPAFFSYKTGAPLVPAFLIPEGRGKYLMVFGQPIYPSTEGDEHTALRSLVGQCAAVLEKKILEDPVQWMMFRDFGVADEHLHFDTGV